MKELSLNVLDIAQNSVTARATLIEIDIHETDEVLEITVSDNGCGMSKDVLERVCDPFCTSRKTRKVGLGIPFFKMQAEMTGGSFSISSKSESEYPTDHGTVTFARFFKNHIDFTPLGDIVSTICTLLQGIGDKIDIVFTHRSNTLNVLLDTREIRKVLGEVSPNEPEVLEWIKEYLSEQYNS